MRGKKWMDAMYLLRYYPTQICALWLQFVYFFLILNTNQRVDSGNQFSTHFKQRLLFVDPF